MGVLVVARDAHAEPVSVHGRTGALVITMGPAGSLDMDVRSAISLRDAIDRGLRIADAQRATQPADPPEHGAGYLDLRGSDPDATQPAERAQAVRKPGESCSACRYERCGDCGGCGCDNERRCGCGYPPGVGARPTQPAERADDGSVAGFAEGVSQGLARWAGESR